MTDDFARGWLGLHIGPVSAHLLFLLIPWRTLGGKRGWRWWIGGPKKGGDIEWAIFKNNTPTSA